MTGYLERYIPVGFAMVTLAGVFFFKDTLVSLSASETISFSSLYSYVFSWAAIQTGFLFGVFGYVAGRDTGFIGAVKSTKPMLLFIKYTRSSIYLGFLLTFYSIPIIVANFKLDRVGNAGFSFVAIWCALAVWAFFTFARVAYIFGLLIRPKDHEVILG